MMFNETFSQGDVRWRDLKMGTKGGTIGSQGCTLTTIANGIANFEIHRTPAELLGDFNAAGVLDENGLIFWPDVPKAIPGLHFHWRQYTLLEPPSFSNRESVSAAIEKIRILLALGQVVPMKLMTTAGQHWVLPRDWSPVDSDFKVIDPDGGREILFGDKYGPLASNLWGYAILIGDAVGTADNIDAETLRRVGLSAGQAVWKTYEGKYSVKEIIDTFI